MRVLILTARAGGGHQSVSLALKDGLLQEGPEGTEVVIADALALARPGLIDQAVRLYGPVIRHAPALYGSVYHLSEHPLVYPALRATAHDTFTGGLKQVIREERPAAVVSVYPLANRPLLDALHQLGSRVPAIAMVTELVSVHPSWAELGFTHWATATEEAREAVMRMRVPAAHVSCFGLPIGERFGRVTEPPPLLRQRMGLDPDRPTVLIVAGAEGAGRLLRLVPALAEANPGGQLIVVCGHNHRAQKRLAKMPLGVPVAVLGFVEQMPELMHATDIVVTKGGPTSIVEALASGRPIVVFDSLPGQEEGNAELVERYGVGLDGRTLPRVQEVVGWLVGDVEARNEMAARARSLAKPDAARATARAVLALATPGTDGNGAAPLRDPSVRTLGHPAAPAPSE